MTKYKEHLEGMNGISTYGLMRPPTSSRSFHNLYHLDKPRRNYAPLYFDTFSKLFFEKGDGYAGRKRGIARNRRKRGIFPGVRKPQKIFSQRSATKNPVIM